MILMLLLLVGTNFSNILTSNYELKRAIGSILIACFVYLAFAHSIVSKEVSLRGSVISKTKNPRLYQIFVVILFCIASAFLVNGILWVF